MCLWQPWQSWADGGHRWGRPSLLSGSSVSRGLFFFLADGTSTRDTLSAPTVRKAVPPVCRPVAYRRGTIGPSPASRDIPRFHAGAFPLKAQFSLPRYVPRMFPRVRESTWQFCATSDLCFASGPNPTPTFMRRYQLNLYGPAGQLGFRCNSPLIRIIRSLKWGILSHQVRLSNFWHSSL